MTCIVGIETRTGVILGADSLSASDYVQQTARIPKLFRVGPYLFGFTTSFRMGDLLRHQLELPPPPKTRLHRHIVKAVIPILRECLREGGFLSSKDGAEVGGEFLLAVGGGLFHVASDYQVGQSAFGYDAAGGGQAVALGALAVTAGQTPRRRLRLALEAAERHCMGVRRPWRFLTERT